MAKTFRLQHVSGVIAGPIDAKGGVSVMADATIEQLVGCMLCWITSCIILLIALFGGDS